MEDLCTLQSFLLEQSQLLIVLGDFEELAVLLPSTRDTSFQPAFGTSHDLDLDLHYLGPKHLQGEHFRKQEWQIV